MKSKEELQKTYMKAWKVYKKISDEHGEGHYEAWKICHRAWRAYCEAVMNEK